MNFPERKFMNRNGVLHLLLLFVCMFAITSQSFGQEAVAAAKKAKQAASAVPEASVAPVVIDRNMSCRDINAIPDDQYGGRLAHIVDNNEFKLNFGDPNGTFPFTHDPTRSVTISSGSHVMPGDDAIVFSWTSQIAITAVNVKVGSTSYIYPYNPYAFGDVNLNTGDSRGISHVTFCYGLTVGPSAGDALAGGRVIDANGRGIFGAVLTLQDAQTGETFMTRTSPFGYYNFEGLEVSKLYFITVARKGYNFPTNSIAFTLNDNLTDLNFVANPY